MMDGTIKDIGPGLRAPFPESQIEWKVQSCGRNGDKIWAMCLAYIQARAVQDRLDEIVGPLNWKIEYHSFLSGVMAKLSIFDSKTGAWISKEDGAEQTDIEGFKGGLSGALKRAGSAWGIGRYLYDLSTGYAKIVTKDTPGALYGQTKEKEKFYWLPPGLPTWAIPKESIKALQPRPFQALDQKASLPDSTQSQIQSTYRLNFGRYDGKTLAEVGVETVRGYVSFLEKDATKKGKKIEGNAAEFIKQAESFLGSFENQPLYPEPPYPAREPGDDDFPLFQP